MAIYLNMFSTEFLTNASTEELEAMVNDIHRQQEETRTNFLDISNTYKKKENDLKAAKNSVQMELQNRKIESLIENYKTVHPAEQLFSDEELNIIITGLNRFVNDKVVMKYFFLQICNHMINFKKQVSEIKVGKIDFHILYNHLQCSIEFKNIWRESLKYNLQFEITTIPDDL